MALPFIQPSIGRGSWSFELHGGVPKVDFPTGVPAAALTNVNGSTFALDGEFLKVDGDGNITRPAGNAAGLTAQADARVCYPIKGLPGESDLQFGVGMPYIRQNDISFRTRLHSGNLAVPNPPTLGAYCTLAIDDVIIAGHTFAGRTILLPTTTAGRTIRALCTEAPDADGWATFKLVSPFPYS